MSETTVVTSTGLSAPSEATQKQIEIQSIASLLSSSETITPAHAAYENESKTWSFGKNLHPKLIVRPDTVEALARVLTALVNSSLEFDVRNSGAGSSSAKDVLISTRALTDFDFDRENEIVTIGAGSLWREYYQNMRQAAPEYSVVAAATPFIGVGGSILAGGFSLMSGEYGCISDPENMVDAEVVKLDGSIVWASSDPDLLWGLRGGYIGLGVVTKLKLRAYRYPQDIWGGHIIIPRSKDQELANAIATMDNSSNVAKRVFALLLLMPDCFIINAFDAFGEQHGRETFTPILNIEGAMDMTKITDLGGFADMQAPGEYMKGLNHVWFNPLALNRLNEDFVMQSFDWQRRMAAQGANASVMYELWGTRGPSSGPSASMWPRSDRVRHFCMLSMAAEPSASADEIAKSRNLIQQAPHDLLGQEYDDSLVATSGLDEYHDIRSIYKANWERILKVKQKFDPRFRMNASSLARACIEDIQKMS